MKKLVPYIVLVGAIAIYACTGVFTRLSADYPFLSWQYVLLMCGAVAVLGIYASAHAGDGTMTFQFNYSF